MSFLDVSVIIPAKNESGSIRNVVADVLQNCPGIEVIVVDDGSTDETPRLAAEAGALVISHAYSKGNGAAIKSGARSATRKFLLFMDADGQHKAESIQALHEAIKNGYDMVVGARTSEGQSGRGRRLANSIYNTLASYMTGHHIPDLTSGMRIVVAERFREFLYLLPNGFSYPTTITMAFFRAGYSVGYRHIAVASRTGVSHIDVFKDGIRFLLIIFKVGTLYSPLKLFFPIAVSLFSLGCFYYIYTFTTDGRFTNMGVLLFLSSIIIFAMGLMSEQLTALLYKT